MRRIDSLALVTFQVADLLNNDPKHTPKCGAGTPSVRLRQAKVCQTRHCCEKLRLVSCTSTGWEQTCVVRLCTIHLLTLIQSIASHRQLKHLGTSQVCNLEIDFTRDTVACGSWFD